MDGKLKNMSTSEYFIPTHVVSDYVQIVYLSTVFCIGTPLNAYTFVRLVRQYYVSRSRMLLLSLHLNISDLMILIFYAFGKICWLVTYKWTAGDVMCKIVRFTHALSVFQSGNVVVCIGLDRFLTLVYPLQVKPKANTRCKRMLTVAWIMAIVCSAPQLHVWILFEVAPNWYQCTDVWKVWQELNTTTAEAQLMKVGYRIFHLAFLFWLPFFVLLIAYAIILKKVYKSLDEENMVFETTSTKSSESSNQDQTTNNKRRNWTSVPNLANKSLVTIQWSGSTRSLKSTSPNSATDLQNTLRMRHASQLRIKRTKHRTLKITMVIVVTYVVCWLPYNLLELWDIIDSKSYESVENYFYFCYDLIVINAMINPLIYSRLSFIFCGKLQRQENKVKVRFNVKD